MTPDIVSQLRSRMQTQPRSLAELHQSAVAAGSSWSREQVALLLACLPDVTNEDGLYSSEVASQDDPVLQALLAMVDSNSVPAPVLVKRMPKGLITTPGALCEIARAHPDLELVGTNRIRLVRGGSGGS